MKWGGRVPESRNWGSIRKGRSPEGGRGDVGGRDPGARGRRLPGRGSLDVAGGLGDGIAQQVRGGSNGVSEPRGS